MQFIRLAAALIPAAILLSGCASLGSTPAAAPSAPAPSTSAAVCTTDACILSDIQASLIGMVAKDEDIATKAVCKKSTLKANPGQSWTATCTVTYSSGMVARGFGNLVLSSRTVTFEPETILNNGSGN